MRRHNQTPSPWNEAGPSAPCKRSKLAAGVLDPVQEAPCCGDASLGEIGGFAMQPSVCARRQQDAVQFRNPFLYIKDLGTLPATYCQKARRQTQERGRSIAAAIRSSFSSTSNGTRTETGVEPTSSGNGLSEWRCVSPYDVDHWRSQFDAGTLLDNASTGGTRFSTSSARRVAIKWSFSSSFSAVPLNGVLDRANAS
jgi:hypothetical protein